jgi:regulator of protease activity HflC (stomatin/prohibitin superfamily)
MKTMKVKTMKIKPALILVGSILAISLIGMLITVDITIIRGDEVGVMETWTDGVVDEVYGPRTYFLIPGFMKEMYPYKISQQKYVMNDIGEEEFGEGRKKDSYLVQSKEGQDMRISMAVQWRRDPLKIVELHKIAKENPEERILRPELMRVVKDAATRREALHVYSGEGLVELQAEIQSKLQDKMGPLSERGIIIDNFVIENIALDPAYVAEIKERQIAVQARLKNIEQTRAAEANADKVKAEAQANYNKTLVEAERDKEKGILDAERAKQERILAAEGAAKEVELAAQAERNRNVLIADGKKEAGILEAQAILAIGKAEAESTKLKLAAYNTEGAESFVNIEVAKSMAQAFQNISGYLPESMSINLLAEQFDQGVSLLVNPSKE